eukprot:gb/GECG01014382.1/.p1 GENE.gb/GECG01014382.1/~~gb/GECG01014382.1/.p1  ORF type:complete len:295 (+),score=37.70 gb/GECG01014382.1/:1-885(+)
MAARSKFLYVLQQGRAVVSERMSRPKGTSMRFVAISDTHRHENRMAIPEGDVLIHTGNLLHKDAAGMKHPLTPGLEELHEFNEWLRTQQHRYRIVLGGNHDLTLEDIGQTKASTILNCATLLNNSPTLIPELDLYIWGTSFSAAAEKGPESRLNAFQSKDLQRQTESEEVSADILLSHGSPKGIRDGKSGSETLRTLTQRVNPMFHVFGHSKLEHGATLQNGTIYVNACNTNNEYKLQYLPIVFDVDMDQLHRYREWKSNNKPEQWDDKTVWENEQVNGEIPRKIYPELSKTQE